MKCYYHSTLDAAGTCKHCSKGLCPTCAVDVGGGLACASSCGAAYLFPLFCAALGALFLIEPHISGRSSNAVLLRLLFGGVFLAFALVIALYQRSWRRRAT